jgi:transcriptional regulator with XRE-family HTH domain
MPDSGPTASRRRLGRRLRVLREKSGLTLEQVVATGLASRTKLWRIEGGQVPVRVADLWALCRLYRAADAEAEELHALAVRTTTPAPWSGFRDSTPDWFRLYLDLEAAAAAIFSFDDSVVPGELQTLDYTTALWRGARPDLVDTQIAPHISLRQQRQQSLLNRDPAPRLSVVIGENVLHRAVGGPNVLARQIEHLRKLAELPHIDIGYVPFSAGAHPAVTGPFRILEFDDVDSPDMAYVELEVGAHYLEKDDELATYRRVRSMLSERAVPIGEFSA